MKYLIVIGLILGVGCGTIQAAISLSRDASYEEKLRYAAAPSEPMTPQRFLRWVAQLSGHPHQWASTPSDTEFQPIVNIQNDRLRIVAAIAHKF